MLHHRRAWLASTLVLAALTAPALADDAAWNDIKANLFEGREIEDGSALIGLEAPTRANDAAIVPIAVEAKTPQTPDGYIKTLYLVIDENPAPLAATIHLTPESGLASIETRLRVNEYSDVRAIAETSNGDLYMTSAFVKAAGGCSAPALKDHDKAMAQLGKMKLRTLGEAHAGRPMQAQVMVSHPNYSGMQIDQLTRHWVPAHFVHTIEVRYEGEPVLTAETDISISENPNFRFYFTPKGPGDLSVTVEDTEGGKFEDAIEVNPGAGA